MLIVVSVLLGFPLLWMVLSSLKTNSQALASPVVWWPHPFEWKNYPQVLSAVPFYRFFLNTLLYSAVTIVGVCISSSLVAYGFSRIRWRGRDVLFQVMVATLLVPFFATLIPLFVMYKRFHMVGWYLPLMVPTFLGSSVFSTFLLRQFFMTIPEPLSDAARVDGANEFYNWVCLGLGAAGLWVALTSVGYVIVLWARHPAGPVPDLWSACVRLALQNLFVTGPLVVVEVVGAVLLGLLDPALMLIGLPLAFLILVRLTAGLGLRRATYRSKKE